MKVTHTKEYQTKLCVSLYKRIKAILNYECGPTKLISRTTLYKPSFATLANYSEDYDLNQSCLNQIQIKYIEGNHITMLDNITLAIDLNKELDSINDAEQK